MVTLLARINAVEQLAWSKDGGRWPSAGREYPKPIRSCR